VVYSNARLYADDSKLLNFSHRLQQDSFIFEEWAAKWQLKVNVDKSCVVNRPDTSYTLYNIAIPVVQNMRDLGVVLSNDLTFSTHVSTIVSRASSKIGLMYRAFSSRSLNFMISFFKTHVRPILEYNCEVWSPYFIQDIDRLENVQRRFSKRIKGLYNLNYNDRLQLCKLESLELKKSLI